MEMIEIEAFVTIADSGTFTRAAGRLGISQPAISRRIDLLEMELESPLFERLRTGARLTDAGETFLPFARRILADARDGATAVREIAAGDRGSVTLALVGTLASTSLTERLKRLRADHPGIRLLPCTANSNEVGRLVQSGEVQLGLRYFDDPSPALESIQVAEDRLVIACAANSGLVPAGSRDASDLTRVPRVSFPVGAGSSGEPFAREADRQLLALGLGDAERIVIDSLTAQKRMIEADFGIGIMLASAIEEEVRLGTMRVIEIDGFSASAPVFLLRRSGGYMSPAMRRMIDAIAIDSSARNLLA